MFLNHCPFKFSYFEKKTYTTYPQVTIKILFNRFRGRKIKDKFLCLITYGQKVFPAHWSEGFEFCRVTIFTTVAFICRKKLHIMLVCSSLVQEDNLKYKTSKSLASWIITNLCRNVVVSHFEFPSSDPCKWLRGDLKKTEKKQYILRYCPNRRGEVNPMSKN